MTQLEIAKPKIANARKKQKPSREAGAVEREEERLLDVVGQEKNEQMLPAGLSQAHAYISASFLSIRLHQRQELVSGLDAALAAIKVMKQRKVANFTLYH
ncbi:hypothetical protein EK904_008846 [Melospiza melodia maxima]|nr:hypothetical protein EK904_008846 [Melospiza melodia maxima]